MIYIQKRHIWHLHIIAIIECYCAILDHWSYDGSVDKLYAKLERVQVWGETYIPVNRIQEISLCSTFDRSILLHSNFPCQSPSLYNLAMPQALCHCKQDLSKHCKYNIILCKMKMGEGGLAMGLTNLIFSKLSQTPRAATISFARVSSKWAQYAYTRNKASVPLSCNDK